MSNSGFNIDGFLEEININSKKFFEDDINKDEDDNIEIKVMDEEELYNTIDYEEKEDEIIEKEIEKPTIIKMKEKIEIDDKSEKEEESNSWEIKLKNYNEDIVELNEFNQQLIQYKKIIDPSGAETRYFSCHCNINNEKDKDDKLIWFTSSHCLSKVYIAISLEKMVEELKTKMKFKNCVSFTKSPFIITWKGDTNKSIDLFESNVHKEKIFKLITGLSSDDFKNLSNNISIVILNSYNGSSTIDVFFTMDIAYKDKNNNSKIFTDYFTFFNKSLKLHHKGEFSEIEKIVSNFGTSMNEEIIYMKSIDLKSETDKEFIKSINSKLRGDLKKVFMETWNSFPEKNLYNCLILVSKILSEAYDSKLHDSLNQLVSAKLKKLRK